LVYEYSSLILLTIIDNFEFKNITFEYIFISELLKHENVEINLTNIRESPIISKEETERKIDTVRRAEKRQEVERLFVDGEHKQVAELLWITLKPHPVADETQPLPQERANQLSLLLHSLYEISISPDSLVHSQKIRTWSQGTQK
jgi:hypothetical protein